MKNISEDNLLDLFIGTLKDNNQHEVCLFEPSSLEKDFMMARKVESKNMPMTTRKSFSKTYRENNVPSSLCGRLGFFNTTTIQTDVPEEHQEG